MHVSVTPLCTTAFNRVALHLLIHMIQTVAVTQKKCCIQIAQHMGHKSQMKGRTRAEMKTTQEKYGSRVQYFKVLSTKTNKIKCGEILASQAPFKWIWDLSKTDVSTQIQVFHNVIPGFWGYSVSNSV